MGIKDIISRIGEKNREKKEMFKRAEQRLRIQQMLEDRQKSSNERELEKFQKEEREVEIKEALDYMRKKRRNEIAFDHNPLNAKNIMKSEWEIMKEPNMFNKKSTMFSEEATVMRNNPNLLKNNKRLCGI